MNKYNIIDCNKLCKELICLGLWDKVNPLLKDCVVDLNNVSKIKTIKGVDE